MNWWGHRSRRLDSAPLRAEFDGLLRPCIDALYRTALRLTGDSSAAEDLLQEACLKAYERFETFEQGSHFKAWIFRILKNAHIDAVRKQARTPIVDVPDDQLDDLRQVYLGTHSAVDGPELRLIQKSFRQEAFRVLQALPTEIGVVVAMALLEELSYQEIADILDCPIGTVRSRLSRGRRKLQAQLQDYVPASVDKRVTSAARSSRGRET